MTRQELYAAIWARPLLQVATDMGVSDWQLRSACMREQIPVPGRGYWAKTTGPNPPLRPKLNGDGSVIVRLPSRAASKFAAQAAATDGPRPDDVVNAARDIDAPPVSGLPRHAEPDRVGGIDWRVLEAASTVWASQRHVLEFLSQLECAATLLPEIAARNVRDAVQRTRLEVRGHDPIKTMLDEIGRNQASGA